jgi:hypothetical protein
LAVLDTSKLWFVVYGCSLGCLCLRMPRDHVKKSGGDYQESVGDDQESVADESLVQAKN